MKLDFHKTKRLGKTLLPQELQDCQIYKQVYRKENINRTTMGFTRIRTHETLA
jgi:hypothetical protein